MTTHSPQSGQKQVAVGRSKLHVAARDYAQKGRAIFPCAPLAKTPLSEHGFHDATTDLARIDAWWTEHPEANIAFDPSSEGMSVIDADDYAVAGGDALISMEIEHGTLPETYTVRTARGGRHLYFKGELAQSQSKLAPHVDTRGRRSGYVLLPPSRLPQGEYVVECNAPVADLPAWPGKLIESLRKAKATAAIDELDTPRALARAEAYLKAQVAAGKVAVEGDMGDTLTFSTACAVLNLGVSEERAVELLDQFWNPHCVPPWPMDELTVKVENAARYSQNEAGSWTAPPPEEILAGAIDGVVARENTKEADDWARRVASFRGLEPDEDADLPEPEFWDDDHILPKFPGGTVGIAYAPTKAFKTFVVLRIALDAILNRGARVLNLAGEGGYGVGKMRIPALCQALGITPAHLRGKYRTVKRAPRLSDPLDIKALMEAHADFKPNIVIIDTLATALAGEDENAAATAALLAGSSPLAALRQAWEAAIICVAHTGKNEDRGIRGSEAFQGNVDFVWRIKRNKVLRQVELHAQKIKDAPDDFSIYFRVDAGVDGTPVAKPLPKHEALKEHEAAASLASAVLPVVKALRILLAKGQKYVETEQLAMMLVPPQETHELQERCIRNEKKRLERNSRIDKKTGKPGPLIEFRAVDHTGEPLDPVQFWLPPSYQEDEDDDDEVWNGVGIRD